MNKRYELVVFDWDGTLMNSEARIVACMQRAASDAGFSVPTRASARDIIGLGMREAVERLFPAADAPGVERLIGAYRGHWLGDQVEAETVFTGALELVSGLHEAGYLLAVATGKSRHGLEKAFEESGLGVYFNASRCADVVSKRFHPHSARRENRYPGRFP